LAYPPGQNVLLALYGEIFHCFLEKTEFFNSIDGEPPFAESEKPWASFAEAVVEKTLARRP
jgi:hypothetical protein